MSESSPSRIIYLALLKECPTQVCTYDQLCVDVINARARKKLKDIYIYAFVCRTRPRSYLAFGSSLLKLPLPGLFLGDARLDRCQGLPRERTEQTSFFLC